MHKRDDSLNSLGRTLIVIDKPTRYNLKLVAENAGMPLSVYLRELANRELANKQGNLLPVNNTEAALNEVRSQVCDMNIAVTALCKFFHLPQSWAEAANEQFPAFPPNELELEVKALQLLASKLANRLSEVAAQQNMIFEGGNKVE